MPPARLAALGCVLTLIACTNAQTNDLDSTKNAPAGDPTTPATTPGDSPAAPPDNTTPSGPSVVCNTPHRTFQVAPVDYYRQFDSSEAARAALAASTPRQFLAAGNDKELRANAIIAKVFDAYKKLYPEATVGMTEPPRVVVEVKDAFNAMAFPMIQWADGTPTSTPWVFEYMTGFFVDGITDDHIAFITAHELGHLLLRNTNPQIFSKIWFRAPATDPFKFGQYQPNDDTVKATGQMVIQLGTRVGQVAPPELNGFGTQNGSNNFTEQTGVTPRYNKLLEYLHTTYAYYTATPPRCVAARTGRESIKTFVQGHYAQTKGALNLGNDAAQLDTLTKAFVSDETTCLVHVKKTIGALVQEYSDATGDALTVTDAEQKLDQSDPNGNLAAKLLQLASADMNGLRSIAADPNVGFDRLRVFTQEDDADESAVRIMKVMGIPLSQAMGGVFLAQPALETTCKAFGTAEPDYAGFVDVHHSPCWRQYRNRQVEAALATCGASWPQ